MQELQDMKTFKHEIDLATVRQFREQLRKINSYDLAECSFVTKTGKIYTPTLEQVEHWKFVGLTNVDFIEMELNEIP